MLSPQANAFRQILDLSGFWDFRFDPDDCGETWGWVGGFADGCPIAVPASWNDQFADGRDNLGPAWYQTYLDLPWGWNQRNVILRFDSVNYHTRVWLNGEFLGEYEGGHLPFEFEVTDRIQPEDNLLVLRVDGRLGPHTVPPGELAPEDMISNITPYPSTSFDFFPYCGIHRPVSLYAVPYGAIYDLTVTTNIQGADGRVQVELTRSQPEADVAHFHLAGNGLDLRQETHTSDAHIQANLHVPHASLWSPEAPNLYTLDVELEKQGQVFDRYSLPIGIRTIQVQGDALLLNGRPLTLKGFGRHEDFPVVGRGYLPPLIVKDYDLMRWIGANSFRTSHYPYAEAMLDLADRLGFLVIDETPAVGLFFKNDQALPRRLALCRQQVSEMIARDKNHPSVIAWSLANEPYIDAPSAEGFFRELSDLTNSLDGTRPVTIASHSRAQDETFDFLDFASINLYYGWYTHFGQIDEACQALEARLDSLYERHGKPILVSEFGADAIPGLHAQPVEMFSEEYQAEFLESYLTTLGKKPYIIGYHVWNLCDFKTGQAVHRVGGMNYKGVFTRDRRPKLAAHRLRKLWREA